MISIAIYISFEKDSDALFWGYSQPFMILYVFNKKSKMDRGCKFTYSSTT